jgi:uncharacterized protein (TIGR02118 family)
MVKMVCFLKRKPGMSMEDFRDYYEGHHVPLIKRLLQFHTSYKRNYLAAPRAGKPWPSAPFDVITEMTFASQEDRRKMVDALRSEEIGGIIAADEENLFDRDAMVVYLVDEYE